MITIFTIPKSFQNSRINIIQTNAIKSWRSFKPNCEIILVGDDEGVAEKAKELNVKHIHGVACNEFRTPLLDSAFDLARENSTNDYLAYINADIMLISDFIKIFRCIKDIGEFLVAGQRWNLGINELIDFRNNNWENALKSDIKKNGKLHPPSGSDYFIFKRESFKNIPAFAVGRVGWDTWMIQEAVTQQMITIDASKIITVIHQNHNYSHQINKGKNKLTSLEGARNVKLVKVKNGFFTLKDMRWELTENGLKKSKSFLVLFKEYIKYNQSHSLFCKLLYRLAVLAKILIKKIITLVKKIYLKNRLKIKIFLNLKRGNNIKIIIGSSGTRQGGWISTEKEILDLTEEKNWCNLFKKDFIYSLLAEHVWEHLTIEDGRIAAKICFRYLKSGGYLRIAVPDGYNSDKEYINQVKPGGIGHGAKDHKVLYNYKTLSKLLASNGFEVNLLEYFNENGKFISKSWDKKDGFIKRSKNFDQRNKGRKIKYTSLIIDAIKLNYES